LIVRALQINSKICVVGDDAQSIYAFRGAITHTEFSEGLRRGENFRLEQNYRSTKHVEAANTVIDKNKTKLDKIV
jgi:DNA helicase-2/ATP-dependent DNA helicase PcrA